MKTIFKIIILTGLLTSTVWAQAQTNTATSNSDSQANSAATGNANGTNTNVINFPSAPSSSAHQETVEYKGTYTMKSAPALYAPPLVTTMTDTCMGSTSVGASFSGFGFNGGSTWTDQNCVRRLDAREFRAMGMNDVAVALLCQNPDNQRAIESTGRTCANQPQPIPTEVALLEPQPPMTESSKTPEPVVADSQVTVNIPNEQPK